MVPFIFDFPLYRFWKQFNATETFIVVSKVSFSELQTIESFILEYTPPVLTTAKVTLEKFKTFALYPYFFL